MFHWIQFFFNKFVFHCIQDLSIESHLFAIKSQIVLNTHTHLTVKDEETKFV